MNTSKKNTSENTRTSLGICMSISEWDYCHTLFLKYLNQKTMFETHGITGQRYQELCSICERIADTMELGNQPHCSYRREQVINNLSYIRNLNNKFVY